MGLLILESRFPGLRSDFDPIADRDPLPLAGSGFLDPFDPLRPDRCPYCGVDLCDGSRNIVTTADAGNAVVLATSHRIRVPATRCAARRALTSTFSGSVAACRWSASGTVIVLGNTPPEVRIRCQVTAIQAITRVNEPMVNNANTSHRCVAGEPGRGGKNGRRAPRARRPVLQSSCHHRRVDRWPSVSREPLRCLARARGVGMLVDRFAAAPPVVLLVGTGEVRAAILTRLLVKTPCPAQVRAPSSESIRVRSHPYCV